MHGATIINKKIIVLVVAEIYIGLLKSRRRALGLIVFRMYFCSKIMIAFHGL
jgi:hypothetical protein